jgi:hypothetical protein
MANAGLALAIMPYEAENLRLPVTERLFAICGAE